MNNKELLNNLKSFLMKDKVELYDVTIGQYVASLIIDNKIEHVKASMFVEKATCVRDGEYMISLVDKVKYKILETKNETITQAQDEELKNNFSKKYILDYKLTKAYDKDKNVINYAKEILNGKNYKSQNEEIEIKDLVNKVKILHK